MMQNSQDTRVWPLPQRFWEGMRLSAMPNNFVSFSLEFMQGWSSFWAVRLRRVFFYDLHLEYDSTSGLYTRAL